MTKITEHAWGLRGRLLDLPRHQLDLIAVDIADLPADDPAAQAREVRRAQTILDLRAAGRRRQAARHTLALSRAR